MIPFYLGRSQDSKAPTSTTTNHWRWSRALSGLDWLIFGFHFWDFMKPFQNLWSMRYQQFAVYVNSLLSVTCKVESLGNVEKSSKASKLGVSHPHPHPVAQNNTQHVEMGDVDNNQKIKLRSFIDSQMGVSKNRGTPKWMVYNGKPY